MEWKKYCAEFLGTAVLLMITMGTIAGVNLFGGVTLGVSTATVVLISLSFGLAVVAMAYAIGAISGCHINPAVTLAMYMRKKIGLVDAAMYFAAQILGAIFGTALIFLTILLMRDASTAQAAMGFNTFENLADSTVRAIFSGMIIEIILTFIFVFTILAVTHYRKNAIVAGVIIGLTLVLVHLMGIFFTGTSVNPARSIAPAIFGGWEALRQSWLFIVAPLIGGALAALAAWCLFRGEVEEKEERS